MDLSNLSPAAGAVQNGNFRRGRGHGSGNGKTAGKIYVGNFVLAEENNKNTNKNQDGDYLYGVRVKN